MFYLDDGSTGGLVEDVLHDFQVVEEVASDFGLSLNRKKTERICDEETTCEAFLSKVSGIQVVAYTANDRTLPIIGIAERAWVLSNLRPVCGEVYGGGPCCFFIRFLFVLTGELPLNRDWKTCIH